MTTTTEPATRAGARAAQFDYDRGLELGLQARPFPAPGRDCQVTEVVYNLTASSRATAFVVSCDGGAGRPGVVLAHGGATDGRHVLAEEASDLARLGFIALLPATSFPGHGDASAIASAVTLAVLTQRRALDVLASPSFR
jgi:hypothetical protein